MRNVPIASQDLEPETSVPANIVTIKIKNDKGCKEFGIDQQYHQCNCKSTEDPQHLLTITLRGIPYLWMSVVKSGSIDV